MTRLLLGAVLAGGRSERFGSDKAAAALHGVALIDHAVEALRPWVDRVAVCGRTGKAGLFLPDRPAADMGPLGGLCAALHHGRAEGFDAVISVGCDTPQLPTGLIERLAVADGPLYLATLPIIGCWPTVLAPDLDAFLAEDRKHAVRAWADRVGAGRIQWDGIANINHPADLAALRQAGG